MIIPFNSKVLEISRKYQEKCLCKSSSFRQGCPNYGRKKGCPPRNLFSYDYEISQPMYLITTDFDLTKHTERIRNAHPDWTEKAIYNPRYWQNTARKIHEEEVLEFMKEHPDYTIERSPEGAGINVDSLCKQLGILLEWPPRNLARIVSIGAIKK